MKCIGFNGNAMPESYLVRTARNSRGNCKIDGQHE
jgi:hypothetical protein